MAGEAAVEILERTHVAHRPAAVAFLPAFGVASGLVVACPHSGRFYPPEMLAKTHLDPFVLRRSEDAFVDHLFSNAPEFGADFLTNTFARAFLDVNRDPEELDPRLIGDLDVWDYDACSARVKAGLGVVPRTLGDDIQIYRNKLNLAEAKARLAEVHGPWHDAIEARLRHHVGEKEMVLLLDCHSMPNGVIGAPSVDIVLGDRFGASCSPVFVNEALRILREAGLRVARNDPYAGGYATQRHGRPTQGRHAMQIEINRSLYMVEGAMTLRPSFGDIKQVMRDVVCALTGVLVARRERLIP